MTKKTSNRTLLHKKTDDLIPYVNNSRTHSPEQINQVASSIAEFGFTNPILIDSKNIIIAGHARLAAAIKLGIDEIPCILLDGLSEAQNKAYVIADNKLAMNAGWDEEALKVEFERLQELDFGLSVLGFDEFEIEALLRGSDFDPGSEDDQGQLDEIAKKTCPECGCEF